MPPTVVLVHDTHSPAGAPLTRGQTVPVELIAQVLGRAHRMAEELDAPDEARAILYVAHCFADELASADPNFDRLRFIQAATEDPA